MECLVTSFNADMSELRAEAVGICGTNLIEEDTPETTISTPS